MRAVFSLILFAAVGCIGEGSGEPKFAMDPLYVEPADGDGIYGFQTWHLFSAEWQQSRSERHYVCGVVVELVGEISEEPCDDCDHAWDLTVDLLETDCAHGVAEDPLFTSINRVALAPIISDIPGDDPHPGTSNAGVVRYGGHEWEYHGWAYPAALDHGGSDAGDWTGETAFAFEPAWVWDLADAEFGSP